MGELILHIGTTKTGTTSLQKFLAINRNRLATNGIAFPKFTDQTGASPARNGIFLNQYCLSLVRQNDSASKTEGQLKDIRDLSKYLRGNNCVLLSDETIYTASNTRDSLATPYWPTMARILADAGADRVTVVIYLRRQDAWIASSWRQIVKTGHKAKEFADYCSSPWARRIMDYANTIESVESAFGGSARIIVRRYDRGSFEGGDIYHDFCDAVSIKWNTSYAIPEAEKNVSLTFDVAEALRTFADEAPNRSPLRTDVLMPLALRMSADAPDAPGTTPFDEEATRTLMEPYLEGNRWISERYLGCEPLFSEKHGGRPVWIPNEGRIAEYRSAFEEALEAYESPSRDEDAAHALSRGLPEYIKRSLKAVRDRLLSR